jgi:ribose-phosphate pyrophosphokinase
MITNNAGIKFNFSKFPGGELHLKVDNYIGYSIYHSDLSNERSITTARIKNPNDLVELLLVLNWFKQEDLKPNLYIPYLPYARQDRFIQNEDFGSDMMADLLNSYDINVVAILDPHSEASCNKIKKIYKISKKRIFEFYTALYDEPIVQYSSIDYIVAPDSGALKSTEDLASNYYFKKPVIISTKHRDTSTGKLSNIKVHNDYDITDKTVMVVDDICDGGGTFVPIAKQLNCKKKILYVTHGIFSKGFEELLQNYDEIITTNSITSTEELSILPGYNKEKVRCIPIDRFGISAYKNV